MTKKKIVFVGMSGGVDSSVTAGILKDQGYHVVGVHLRCWNIDGCAEADAEDARRAAETLGIPFYVFDFEKEYRQRVVDYMVQGYKKGITPNPDVMCNHEIKFGMFFERAMAMGADYVATGHYVKLSKKKARNTKYEIRNKRAVSKQGKEKQVTVYGLQSAADSDKDQSYFLWMLTQKQLAHCLFPLGDLIKKTDVRRLAKKYKLPNALKKDSQGVCFLGQISLPEFLDEFITPKKGKIVSADGKVLGEHTGAHKFTIGQRKGLGVGGSPVPLYVAAKDIKKNTITLAPEDNEALLCSKVTLTDVNIIAGGSLNNVTKLLSGAEVYVRIRYRQPLFKARFVGASLVFKEPQKFVAPGQSAVFYGADLPAGRQVLGGGVIAKVG